MFDLDPILRRDSLQIVESPSVIVLLMDDTRFPWIVLVPKVANATELSDLPDQSFVEAMVLSRDVGDEMRRIFDADKINIASIGNVVSQLHVHVVARRRDDEVWPAPIWGNGKPIAMSREVREERIFQLQQCDTLRRLQN